MKLPPVVPIHLPLPIQDMAPEERHELIGRGTVEFGWQAQSPADGTYAPLLAVPFKVDSGVAAPIRLVADAEIALGRYGVLATGRLALAYVDYNCDLALISGESLSIELPADFATVWANATGTAF